MQISEKRNNSQKIHILSGEIINKIAAGEVIENPASAVKELIENSIDAGSTKICIQTEDAGKSKICITDNGEGMSKADLSVCYLRHTTSKLLDSDDLFRLKTNGFRGEAIASIAAISKMTITTKQQNETEGYSICIEGNEPQDIKTVACAKGTTILVENLFFNTPVRRNFLKSTAYEDSKILDTIEHLAIAHPEIRFEYRMGGKDVFLGSASDLRGRIAEALGAGIAKKMLPVDYTENNIHVTGFIAPPEEAVKKRTVPYFYLQNRPIWNTMLNKAVFQAYEPYAKGRAITILFISLPENQFDVNVHPAKREVRFANETDVFLAVHHAVKTTLRNTVFSNSNRPLLHLNEHCKQSSLAENISPFQTPPTKPLTTSAAPVASQTDFTVNSNPLPIENHFNPTPRSASQKQIFDSPTTNTSKILKAENAPFSVLDTNDFLETKTVAPSNTPFSYKPEAETAIDLFNAPPSNMISLQKELNYAKPQPNENAVNSLGTQFLQIAKTFIVCEDGGDLLILDQNAAHSRILYEQALRTLKNKKHIDSQELLFPETIEVTKQEKFTLERYSETFERLGFYLEPFGGESFLIRAIPAKLSISQTIRAIRNFLEEIEKETLPGKDPVTETFAKAWAKTNAHSAGTILEQEEMAHLMTQLLQTDEPTESPFKRPTLMRLTSDELRKKFKRS